MLLMWDPGHWAIPIGLFLFTYGIAESIRTKSLKPILCLIFIFILALGLGAIKFIPTFKYALDHQRLTLSEEFTSLKGLYHVLLNREQNLNAKYFDSQKWGWWEYGAYIGWIPLALTVIGLLILWKRELSLFLTGILMISLAMGDFGSWSPWNLLHKLPLINSLYVPSRFIILVMFVIAIISGLAIEKLFKKSEKLPAVKLLLLLLVAATTVDLFLISRQSLLGTFSHAPISVESDRVFHHLIDNNPGRSGAASSMYLNLLANRGTLNAYDNVPHQAFAKSIGDQNYKGELYLEDAGTASYQHWSPNRLVVDVEVDNETRVIINQNYDDGWKVKGRKAENFNGLLSSKVFPNDHMIEFYYLPNEFMIGTIISLLFLLGAVLLLIKRKVWIG